MGQTLTWGTPPPKFSYLKLFQLLVLTGLFYFSSGISQVIKTVRDTAVLSCGYNISADDLARVRIYWQKNSEVVLSVISGVEEVRPKYKNRTITSITNNPSIVIMALHLSDNGTYTCVIQKLIKGSYQRVHLSLVTLLVRADFPVPTITELENPSANIKRIICSTSGGFPKPHLSWLENGKELNAINTTVSQDPESELYTISSELDFNVTNNHSFVCLVKYGNLTVSQIFNWQKPETLPSNLLLWLCAAILGSVILSCAIGIYCICCRPAARERRNSEDVEMERMTPIESRSAETSR